MPNSGKLDLENKLKLIPESTGVYLHKNLKGKVLYVGKAKVLKNRVKSYFLESSKQTDRIQNLVKEIQDLEWIITSTESEALILEDQLIKLYKPKYNVALRDDKSYPFLKLTISEMFPRLIFTREKKKDGSLYFGPYVSVFDARKTLNIIHKYFTLRQKPLTLDGSKIFKPCLNYQMLRCFAPCAGLISEKDYGVIVAQVEKLLLGELQELITELETKMNLCAKELRFEVAGKIRNQISIVKHTLKKQKVVSNSKLDQDVFAIVRDSGFAGVQVLFLRSGILLSHDFIFFKKGENYEDEELFRSTFSRLYLSGPAVIPDELISPVLYQHTSMFKAYLAGRKNKRVRFVSGSKGKGLSLYKLAVKNGIQNMKLQLEILSSDQLILQEAKDKLHLQKLPIRVECFDISNISGSYTVASMVVSENNKPLKKDYKKYKINTVTGPDDFASMEEVLIRRYKRALSQELPMPDLILIDGGKGQLNRALQIFHNLNIPLEEVDIIGLAKGRSKKRSGKTSLEIDFEYVVKPNRKNEIQMKKNSSTLHFLQRIRDEAHQFAIEYHRKLRSKNTIRSKLESIPGIGPSKRKNLLQTFKSIQGVAKAEKMELQTVAGISKKDVFNIQKYFKEI